MESSKIQFTDSETGEVEEFFVLAETQFLGNQYLLATDKGPEAKDGEAYVFMRTKEDGDDAVYEPVFEEEILRPVISVFEELLEDTGIEW